MAETGSEQDPSQIAALRLLVQDMVAEMVRQQLPAIIKAQMAIELQRLQQEEALARRLHEAFAARIIETAWQMTQAMVHQQLPLIAAEMVRQESAES
ncbi:MAG: hypothetical protein HQL58_08485 [Magnetococcales bacterium]|nr:hypothetical protein [Magnetococcales bacterium]